MGIIDKVKAVKETVVESLDEYSIIKDMSANDVAKRYGYEKLLSCIRNKLIMSQSEPIVIVEGEEPSEENNKPVLIKYKKAKVDNKITICEEGFGEKDEYDLGIIKFMLKKYGAETSIGKIDDDDYLQIKMMPKKSSLEERAEELYENRAEYIETIKDKANQAKTTAKDTTKRLINNLADWANNNL